MLQSLNAPYPMLAFESLLRSWIFLNLMEYYGHIHATITERSVSDAGLRVSSTLLDISESYGILWTYSCCDH